MSYQVTLHTGEIMTLHGVNMDAAAFMHTLNNAGPKFVLLGGAIVDKAVIASIIPVGDQQQDEGGFENE